MLVVLEIFAGIGALVFIVGFFVMIVGVVFDVQNEAPEYGIRAAVLGLIGALVFGVPALLLQPGVPMSRAIVGDKKHTSTTIMVMSGKVLVPMHTETWQLISTEGATCNVPSTSYEAYRTGDAVVCGWW